MFYKWLSPLALVSLIVFTIFACRPIKESDPINPVLYEIPPMNYTRAEKIVHDLSLNYARILGYNEPIRKIFIRRMDGVGVIVDIEAPAQPLWGAEVFFNEENVIVFTFIPSFIKYYGIINFTDEDRQSAATLLGEDVCFYDTNCYLVESHKYDLDCTTELVQFDESYVPNNVASPYSRISDENLLKLYECVCRPTFGLISHGQPHLYKFIVNQSEPDYDRRKELCRDEFEKRYNFTLTSGHVFTSVKNEGFECDFEFVHHEPKACIRVYNLNFTLDTDSEHNRNKIIINSKYNIKGIEICDEKCELQAGKNVITTPKKCLNKCVQITYKGYLLGTVNCQVHI